MVEIPARCQRFEEELSALLDGELAPEREVEVQTHLADCDRCSQQLDALRRVDTALNAAPVPAVSEVLRAQLEARVAQETRSSQRGAIPRTPRRRPRWLSRSAATLAAAAAALALYLALGGGERSAPEEAPRIAQRPEPAPHPELAPEPAPLEEPPQTRVAVREEPSDAERAPLPPERVEPAPDDVVIAEASDEELTLALELETIEDLDVIANLEALEALLALEEGTG